ncbi:hypothetical protein TVAG_025680 [Trichomonas vaginalis G3]|uniref:Replication factor A protein 3 n=1 Tax=Trichomonas vaginalis (strain ATCC PRA-98 / G3) TaxID=412133 RepID=A2F0J0_TRIV3|nr:hypothetical protein TVAGG3_0328890 [Trichomonas vaginalis G3]EAY01570.1 hypothetical protein TVAG_025680 [Trichomonas vaginalis G3]KAI5529815.1 hypothetical protein TVAGG3_0328890 [Trichomonas vaginalis G3]|eukprot:XP_001314211.1 hypothetical protein [Trichomonas vaginalis G3]
MEKTSSYAQYATIEEILRGGYARQLVRILGTLEKIEIQNRTALVESNNSQIECQIPEEFLSNISSGMYIQVYGEVIPSVPNPKILARIVRQMNTIDEESYNFAVNVFQKYVYPSK